MSLQKLTVAFVRKDLSLLMESSTVVLMHVLLQRHDCMACFRMFWHVLARVLAWWDQL